MNNICIIGQLTKDSELKYAKGTGTPYLIFTVAVNRLNKDAGADFIPVTVFGNLAEKLAEFYVKGLRVSVVGRLQINNTKSEDGSYKTFVNIIANETRALSNKKANNEDSDFGSPAFEEDVEW